ncbi:spermatid maturation protein 1 isoform X1 [Antechinus flavipes]|uniref:spermatid maturation protein 1 isoform X1 n=1 Tax=Antechinus flavipes TaxID=38775 RepID=UPI0022357F40|nr:spermatid maturation protein 1 isoform X1 [Antechinus flavipes]
MGNPFQQGTHSCSGRGSENCQNLGEYILVFLGLIIFINIGLNVVTLLRCRLRGSFNQIFHNFFQEDNMLKLAPVVPKKLLIHTPPALKQTWRPAYREPPVYRNSPVCQNPAVCWKSPICRNHSVFPNSAARWNPAVCQNLALSDHCSMDTLTLDVTPPGSCFQHSVFSSEPKQCLDAKLPIGDDKVSHSPTPQAQWEELSTCPPSPATHFQQYLGRPAKRVEAKSRMELKAYVYPSKPSSHNADSQSCRENTESGTYGYFSQLFHQVTVKPLSYNSVPSTSHVMYNSWEKKRQVWKENRGIDSLPHARPPDSPEKPSQEWVYYSME